MSSAIHQIYSRLTASSIARRIAGGAFWSMTGVALAKFLILVAGIVCARLLGTVGFGELGIVRSTIGMFVILGSAGVGMTASKFIAEQRARDDRHAIASTCTVSYYIALVCALIISVAVLIAASPMAHGILHKPELTVDLQLGSLLLFMSVVTGVQGGILAGFEAFRAVSINTLASGVVECGGIIAGSWLAGVEGAVIGYGVSFVVWVIINQVSINRLLRRQGIVLERRCSRAEVSRLLRFSIPVLLNTLMVAPAFWCIKTLLVNHGGYADLGVFEAADQWKIIILFVPGAIANIIVPILSHTNSSESGGSFRKVLYCSMALNGAVAAILCALLWFAKDWVMMLYGTGFDDPSMLFILCLSTIPTSVAQVLTLSMISVGHTWPSFWFNFLWAILLILFSYMLLMRGMGASALAWANLWAYLLHAIVQFLYICRIPAMRRNLSINNHHVQ